MRGKTPAKEDITIKASSLVEAVGAWLYFEDKCRRDNLFSERHMAHPIGQFLQAQLQGPVHAEYPHPVLAPSHIGKGDKPRIDFAVPNQANPIGLAIETKWTQRGGSELSGIIADLIRLELVAHCGATAILLVAGKRKSLRSLSSARAFVSGSSQPRTSQLLPTEGGRKRVVRLDPAPSHRSKIIKKGTEPFQGLQIARAFFVRSVRPFPREVPLYQHTVHGWFVSSLGKERRTFVPE